ncbi:MAG: AarF/ABC1/UbiB kinase family protein [Pseudomonadota bacterium]
MSRKPTATSVPASRISRLTHLGSMTAGVAGNMALGSLAEISKGRRPAMRDLLLTPANLTRIANRLAEMRGAAMKIGQLVSMDTGDVLPPELAQIMARLRDDAHIMPPSQLKQVLNSHWPKGWLQAFQTFDVHPIAAASIGQVHRAKLKDGRDMAIKVQYPGVARSIDADVANVGALIKMTGLLPKGFELGPYLEEAKAQLHEETDYLREATHLRDFRALLANDERFLLPDVHQDWTTEAILAMDFIDSVEIESVADTEQDTRDRVARTLIELMLAELFRFATMQTDPNFANYRYQPATGQIVLLDFGATRVIAPEIAAIYHRLLKAGLDGDRVRLRSAALELGLFVESTEARHADRITGMMEMLFAEITAAPEMDFGTTDLTRRMQVEGTALAEAGFVPPPLPVDALFPQRKFGGMFLLAARLRARVPVHALLREHLEDAASVG